MNIGPVKKYYCIRQLISNKILLLKYFAISFKGKKKSLIDVNIYKALIQILIKINLF